MAWGSKQGRYKRSPRAERTDADGNVFDSKAELKRWAELKYLERSGAISQLTRQHKMPLAFNGRAIKIRSAGYPQGRACIYTVDFRYWDYALDRAVYEEFKGHDDTASRLRRAVAEAVYDIEITVTGSAASRTPKMA